jgi:hypothetical protein
MMYATADTLARAVYRAMPDVYDNMGNPLVNWFDRPDSSEVIEYRGWKLVIVDDPDDDHQHGLSWYLDSPEEPLCQSDGWEELPAQQIQDAAAKLAAMLASK